MSVHAQFTALALAGLALTAPALAYAWRRRLRDRRLATTLYTSGSCHRHSSYMASFLALVSPAWRWRWRSFIWPGVRDAQPSGASLQ